MTEGLARLEIKRLTGDEPFTDNGAATDFSVRDFWQWASSDLVVNLVRGLVAEFLVAKALGLADGVRDPWQPYDLKTNGGLTIEVKSAAYLQTWWQRTHTDIWFTARATRAWDPNTNELAPSRRWQADIFVFALLHHRNKQTVDPREINQWEFYVVPTKALAQRAGAGQQLSLKSIQKIQSKPVNYRNLSGAIHTLEIDKGWQSAGDTE
ncbi:MAG TPA: hypothetical protein VJ865_02760 [Gemmatimonadaceae bacterium]|nr:hypothetical protein [Gemmatimonadaceae bacterium]